MVWDGRGDAFIISNLVWVYIALLNLQGMDGPGAPLAMGVELETAVGGRWVKRLYLAVKGREVFAQLKESRREKIIFLIYN